MIHIAYEPYNLKSEAACKEAGQIVSQRVAINIMLYGSTFHPIEPHDLCHRCMAILEPVMGERLAELTGEWGQDTDDWKKHDHQDHFAAADYYDEIARNQ